MRGLRQSIRRNILTSRIITVVLGAFPLAQ
jgi:hypothetical protein